jgi:hypothetical protein
MIARTPERLDIAARQRWTRLFGNADIEPRDLPPAAVLFVRRLPDPLPRCALPRPDAQSLSPEWEAGVRSALSDCYWRAAIAGYPTQAPGGLAVAFADTSEMLAALTIDLGAGEARRRWWWRAATRGLPTSPAESICALWIARPELIPAIIERLAVQGQHVSVLALLTPRQASVLAMEMARAFDLAPLAGVLAEFTPDLAQPEKMATWIRAAAGPPPWDRVTPPSPSLADLLPLAHNLLVGVALQLRRATHVVGRPGFAEATARWLASLRTGAPAAANSAMPFTPQPDAAFTPPADPPWNAPAVVASLQQPALATPSTPATAAPAVAENRAPSPAPHFVDTELGGLLFLINLIDGLDLLRVMDRDFGIAPELGPWALLEMMSRCLLTRSERRYLADPIWRVLAELDGRAPNDPVAPTFQGAAEYLLPESWTAFLPQPKALRAKFRGGRVQLWEPSGFMLADAPAARWHALANARPVERRRGSAPGAHPVGRDCSPPLRRFLAFLMPYVRWRLQTWLGNPLTRALLLRRGRLYVTPTHVDLVLPLNQATVPVRAAGLDTNPGWRPRLGRIVAFHYQ